MCCCIPLFIQNPAVLAWVAIHASYFTINIWYLCFNQKCRELRDSISDKVFLTKNHEPFEIYLQLYEKYDTNLITEGGVCQWSISFKNGWTDIHDERTGRTRSISTDEMVVKVVDNKLPSLHVNFTLQASLYGIVIFVKNWAKVLSLWNCNFLGSCHKLSWPVHQSQYSDVDPLLIMNVSSAIFEPIVPVVHSVFSGYIGDERLVQLLIIFYQYIFFSRKPYHWLHLTTRSISDRNTNFKCLL